MGSSSGKTKSTVPSEVGTYDVCGLRNDKFIIQASVGYVKVPSLGAEIRGSDMRPMHKECMYGDHYLAKYEVELPPNQGHSHIAEISFSGVVEKEEKKETTAFFILKGKSCIKVNDLSVGHLEVKTIFDLHPECQGGCFYFANSTGFYLIYSDNTFLQASDISSTKYRSSTASRLKLHESFANGVYYFATDDYFYVVKEHSEFGLVYHRTKDLRSNEEVAVLSISPSITKFLQGYSLEDHQIDELQGESIVR